MTPNPLAVSPSARLVETVFLYRVKSPKANISPFAFGMPFNCSQLMDLKNNIRNVSFAFWPFSQKSPHLAFSGIQL
jgi:hypothetical protein